jgi:hypothetical protein
MNDATLKQIAAVNPTKKHQGSRMSRYDTFRTIDDAEHDMAEAAPPSSRPIRRTSARRAPLRAKVLHAAATMHADNRVVTPGGRRPQCVRSVTIQIPGVSFERGA